MLRLLLFPLILALPLNRAPVPTTIEGTAVTIYISGDADVSFVDEGASIDASLRIDLSDIQTKFPTIVRSRKISESCKEEVTITASALRRNGDHAEAAGRATDEQWECTGGKRQKLQSSETGSVRLRIDVARTQDNWVAFSVTVLSVEGSARLQKILAQNLAGPTFAKATEQALGHSLSPAMVTAPLPDDLRSLQPQINDVHFVDTGDTNIELAVDASLTVPPDKLPLLLAWAFGGHQ